MFTESNEHRAWIRAVTHFPPIPTNAPKASVHAFAEQVADRLGFGAGDPLEPLVAKLGGRIEYRAPVVSDQRLPESIVVENARKFTIFVASITSLERDRFTIAHELGHLFLHYPIVAQNHPGAAMAATRWVDETDKVQQRAEWEANWFAAAFLMPSAKFQLAFVECGGSLGRVASRFGVSSPAAQIRAKTLSLI
jgi:predicted transcriptional regulator